MLPGSEDRAGANPLLRRRGLYLLTPDWPDDARLVTAVARALAGGPALLQYRNKAVDDAQRRRQLARLLPLCRQAGVPLVINDSLALALETGADGVHLGREDGEPSEARRLLGPGRLLGVSCYDEWSRAEQAAAAGADYVAFGAMFPSATKPAAVRAPLALVGRARALGVGVVAIGGLTPANAPAVLAAGAHWLAVVSDVFNAPDPLVRVRQWQVLFCGRNRDEQS